MMGKKTAKQLLEKRRDHETDIATLEYLIRVNKVSIAEIDKILSEEFGDESSPPVIVDPTVQRELKE